MKRTAELKRTGFKPAEPKPAKGPKPKKCANRACRAPFAPDPRAPFQTWCSGDCAVVIGMEKVAKQKAAKAKSERAELKRRKQDGMKMSDRLAAVQALANKVAVVRDAADGCISCDKGPYWNGTWHGSHFKSVGSNSALRFNLLNIHKACSQCNWHMGGNIANYEPRLALKIGADRLDWIKHHPRSREYTPEYLTRLAKVLRRLIKRYERRKP